MSFGNSIEAQIACATQLLGLLGEEFDALRREDPDSIERLAREKQSLVIALDQHTAQFRTKIEAQGFHWSHQGIEASLAVPSREPTDLQARWRHLLEVMQQCLKQNAINGQLASASRRYTELVLSLVRGELTPGGSIYGANGQPDQDQPGARLGKA